VIASELVSPPSKLLFVGIGDIHGRFHRVAQWISQLEMARSREVSAVFAVGDVEAFTQPEHHNRKTSKRGMPAEFSEYAAGTLKMRRPLYFIGGNNEDFAPLHAMQHGGTLAPNVHYLGRYGALEVDGIKVAFLSGIYAPRHYATPLVEPTTRETSKQAGYFRSVEVEQFLDVERADLMLTHEWPKGLVGKHRGSGKGLALRAYSFPWVGNPITRQLVDRIRPSWLWAGHSHVPFAATIGHADGSLTRVACLDQAARPEGALFWLEWDHGSPVRGGWGPTGEIHWSSGDPWTPAQTPVTLEAPSPDLQS